MPEFKNESAPVWPWSCRYRYRHCRFSPGPASPLAAVTVATFPNAWEQAYNKVIVPMLAAKGTTLTIAPALTTAQIAKMLAAKQGSAPPPYDALLLSPGDIVVAEKNDLLQEIDPSKIPNWSKLCRRARANTARP